jgi:hypothetical protein
MRRRVDLAVLVIVATDMTGYVGGLAGRGALLYMDYGGHSAKLSGYVWLARIRGSRGPCLKNTGIVNSRFEPFCHAASYDRSQINRETGG